LIGEYSADAIKAKIEEVELNLNSATSVQECASCSPSESSQLNIIIVGSSSRITAHQWADERAKRPPTFHVRRILSVLLPPMFRRESGSHKDGRVRQVGPKVGF
jgi:hypothetical protein